MNNGAVKAFLQNILPPFLYGFLKRRFSHPCQRTRIALSGVPEEAAEKSPYPFLVSSDNPLHALGETWQPTKRLHNYLPLYWMHFRDIRQSVRNVIEIGVQTECSVRMWEEFFPNATIHGLDIDPACKCHEGGRIRIHTGSQADPAFLRSVLDAMEGAPDIVIDDGSHAPNHQIATFNELFPALSQHGVYVIEDTGGVVNDMELQTVNEMKTLVDHVMHWPDSYDPSDWPYLHTFGDAASWAERHVIGVAFYRWICFVFRGRNPEDNPYLTPKRSGARLD